MPASRIAALELLDRIPVKYFSALSQTVEGGSLDSVDSRIYRIRRFADAASPVPLSIAAGDQLGRGNRIDTGIQDSRS